MAAAAGFHSWTYIYRDFFLSTSFLSYVTPCSHKCDHVVLFVVLRATAVHSSAAFFLSERELISFGLPLVFTKSQTCQKKKNKTPFRKYFNIHPHSSLMLMIIICTLVLFSVLYHSELMYCNLACNHAIKLSRLLSIKSSFAPSRVQKKEKQSQEESQVFIECSFTLSF